MERVFEHLFHNHPWKIRFFHLDRDLFFWDGILGWQQRRSSGCVKFKLSILLLKLSKATHQKKKREHFRIWVADVMSFQKMYGLRGPWGLNIIKNQAFRIKIAHRSKEEEEEEKEKEEKIPGIGRYPMGPTTKQTSLCENTLTRLDQIRQFTSGSCLWIRYYLVFLQNKNLWHSTPWLILCR